MSINEIWFSQDENVWLTALNNYWNQIPPQNQPREQYFCDEIINDLINIANMNGELFFNFLHENYFPWKYTAANRLTTTRYHLQRYQRENNVLELGNIKEQLFNLNHQNIQNSLAIAMQIHGLGVAGASGLISVFFPNFYGTVDQFVVTGLVQIENYPMHNELVAINPQQININQGVLLIEIMRQKATELNTLFNNHNWTPRKIDMILWGNRE